jgi:hypothetical protein
LRRASKLRRKKREEFLGRLIQTRKGRRVIQSCERKRNKDRRRRRRKRSRHGRRFRKSYAKKIPEKISTVWSALKAFQFVKKKGWCMSFYSNEGKTMMWMEEDYDMDGEWEAEIAPQKQRRVSYD